MPFFENASDVTINGGEFNSIDGDHIVHNNFPPTGAGRGSHSHERYDERRSMHSTWAGNQRPPPQEARFTTPQFTTPQFPNSHTPSYMPSNSGQSRQFNDAMSNNVGANRDGSMDTRMANLSINDPVRFHGHGPQPSSTSPSLSSNYYNSNDNSFQSFGTKKVVNRRGYLKQGYLESDAPNTSSNSDWTLEESSEDEEPTQDNDIIPESAVDS